MDITDGSNASRVDASLIIKDWMLRFAKYMTVAKDATVVRKSPRSFGSGAAGWAKTVWPKGCAKPG